MYFLNKKIYRLALIIAISSILSCDSNKTDIEENVVHDNDFDIRKVSDFEVIEFTGRFEPSMEGKDLIFNATLKIKNNTPNTLNKVEIISAIKAQYKNEKKPKYFPDNHNFDFQSDIEYLEGYETTKNGGLNNYRSRDKWLPGQVKSFNFKIFSFYGFGWEVIGFGNPMFERTPDYVEFIAAYKFIGLDGEYKDILYINILDLWKQYQTEIGLR